MWADTVNACNEYEVSCVCKIYTQNEKYFLKKILKYCNNAIKNINQYMQSIIICKFL